MMNSELATMIFSENPNTHWAWLFVDGLAQSGLDAAVIAPGSRSTPLTLAFHAHPNIKVYRHLDERGAGFFALGMALAGDRPVALVCSSGTAVANFLPALVEAKMSHVPLLALTADRPHELRHSGANQTIDQVKIYGDQVLWSVDMPIPHADAPEVILRHVQTLAARAYAAANGLVKGPVHVNFPFRKPLEPVKREHSQSTISHSKFTIQHGRFLPTDTQLDQLAAILNRHERGLIVCGPRCPGGEFAAAVIQLATHAGCPILADPLSGVRFHPRGAEKMIVGGYETFLQGDPGWEEPEVILRFGAVPTSKWLNAYLDRIRPAHRIHIRANGVWADDSHRTTWFLQADETAVLQSLLPLIIPRPDSAWAKQVMAAETAVWRKVETALQDVYFDGAVIHDIVNALPDGSILFTGNSLAVRHLDQFGRPSAKNIHVFGNRGASGIDGNISTALGIAAATGKPVTAVLGDITALHDLNGLQVASGKWQAASNKPTSLPPATFILINNNGGGIFRRLPVSQHEPAFTDLFLTPHGLNFEHAAAMFGLAYMRVVNRAALAAALDKQASTPRLIEVVTDGEADERIRSELIENVRP
ncbi:MAG: 2-succinyl-5-enolpyruvyl-6-hydroxy-3-cyclohexene-1-carboxylic-acid synthase [Candidatus Promineifilaceae bacterium]